MFVPSRPVPGLRTHMHTRLHTLGLRYVDADRPFYCFGRREQGRPLQYFERFRLSPYLFRRRHRCTPHPPNRPPNPRSDRNNAYVHTCPLFFQAGTAEEDSFHDAVVATTAAAAASSVDAQGLESASPTIVLAGFTRGDWSGAGRSSGGGSGADFAALGLDADGGSELWRWQVHSRYFEVAGRARCFLRWECFSSLGSDPDGVDRPTQKARVLECG